MDASRFQTIFDRLEQLTRECEELQLDVRRALSLAEIDPEMSLTRARKILEFVVAGVTGD